MSEFIPLFIVFAAVLAVGIGIFAWIFGCIKTNDAISSDKNANNNISSIPSGPNSRNQEYFVEHNNNNSPFLARNLNTSEKSSPISNVKSSGVFSNRSSTNSNQNHPPADFSFQLRLDHFVPLSHQDRAGARSF